MVCGGWVDGCGMFGVNRWCLVEGWLEYGLFFGSDYLRRQEKHINGESYIFRCVGYPVILWVGISYTP